MSQSPSVSPSSDVLRADSAPATPAPARAGARGARRHHPAVSQLLADAFAAGVASVRQVALALRVEPAVIERACADGVRLPPEQQHAIALLLLQRAGAHPALRRRAHALRAQAEAALRVEHGDTACHVLAPVYWR